MILCIEVKNNIYHIKLYYYNIDRIFCKVRSKYKREFKSLDDILLYMNKQKYDINQMSYIHEDSIHLYIDKVISLELTFNLIKNKLIYNKMLYG